MDVRTWTYGDVVFIVGHDGKQIVLTCLADCTQHKFATEAEARQLAQGYEPVGHFENNG